MIIARAGGRPCLIRGSRSLLINDSMSKSAKTGTALILRTPGAFIVIRAQVAVLAFLFGCHPGISATAFEIVDPSGDIELTEWNFASGSTPATPDTVTAAGFAQPETNEQLPSPSFLEEEPDLTVDEEISRLWRRIDELEKTKTANEDAIRTIITRSFAQRGSNITDAVIFGGTLETLTFWQEDFDGVAESDIVLDTVELDFEIAVTNWAYASVVFEYFEDNDILFPTNQGDEAGVDRVIVREGIIVVGDLTKYPLFGTVGRAVVPFGISTGDPVTDVLTIVDPLTVEVFESREDFVMIGFAGPVPPLPPPVSPGSPPAPLPPQPLIFNPLVRRAATRMCEYCGPYAAPEKLPPYVPPPCVPPINGAVYFFNGDTIDELNGEDHIEHMGGTLGYKRRGVVGPYGTPWTIDCDVDVTSSVFDSDFLQFEYRSFLDQIGFVPGMAAHAKTSYGPVGFIVEWNGAISDADFIDDTGNPISIQPGAWQVSVAYQFDWNPYVEVIGAQGTYVTAGYSESQDLAGVNRIFDPLVPVPTRVGFVPERRFSVGVGEWVLPSLRVAFEWSHVIDYDEADGGTGNSANGYFWQMTYEW
jgi:hypothetical protein